MNSKIFKKIPGYEDYGVTEEGVIKSLKSGRVLAESILNGYKNIGLSRSQKTKTLPLHRAVALAWLENKDPDVRDCVNHKDGNPLNNHKDNLEWVSKSENNYHAVNTGLREDNLRCKIRNAYTGEVLEFPSISQASKYMGYSRHIPNCMLLPKKFGALLKGKYEFRYEEDDKPWFYKDGDEPITPSRFMVIVRNKDGEVIDKVTGQRGMLKGYQLYRSKSKSIPAMTEDARELYPELTFELLDAYDVETIKSYKTTNENITRPISARKGKEVKHFSSTKEAARFFNRTSFWVLRRLENKIEMDGWELYEGSLNE